MLKFYIFQLQLFSPLVQFAIAIVFLSSLPQLKYNFLIICISFFLNKIPMRLNKPLQIK